MTHTSAFQLESLSYQNDAVESVVRVFEGTPKPAAADLAGNRCALSWAQISANLQAIAQRHRISGERLNLSAPAQGQALDVCVEMETGTGKTLVYLRTLYRLHGVYGWSKFIIVVPTVAIRAGVMGTLADFGEQLAQQNGLNHPIPAFEYDSSRLQQLKTFIDSPIVCFDSQLDITTLDWLGQQTGQRVIVLEAALDTTGKWNLYHQLGDGLVVF